MKDINDMTEKQQIKRVRKNPFLLEEIKYSSEKVQLEAVKINGDIITMEETLEPQVL